MLGTAQRRPGRAGSGREAARSTSRRRSATALQPLEQPITLAHPIRPEGSSYAISKTAGEQYIALSGLDFVSFRLANAYGPRNLSGPLPTFFQRLTQGKPCFVMDTRRDFIFVDDLVDVVVKAIDGEGGTATTTSRPAPTTRSRSSSTRRSRRWASSSTSDVEVRPRDRGRRVHDPARPVADRAPTSAGESRRRSRTASRARSTTTASTASHETFTHLKPIEPMDEPMQQTSGLTGSAVARRRRRRVRRHQPGPGAAGPRAARVVVVDNLLSRGARERARRPARRVPSRGRSPTTAMLCATSGTTSTTSSISRRITATRARSPTRSPITRTTLLTTLKLYERAQGLRRLRRSSTRRPAARVAREDVRRRGGHDRGRAGVARPRQPVSDLEDRRRVLLDVLPPGHWAPDRAARFQNVYGPGRSSARAAGAARLPRSGAT